MSASLIVGLDLGTSGMKAIAVDSSGNVVARGQSSYPTYRPEFGASEQNPADWIAATIDCAQQIRQQTNNADWAVIGLSGMLPTLVTLDSANVPCGPAITWEDGRADSDGELLAERIGVDALYKLTGQIVDGRYLLPMFMRLCRVAPEQVARTEIILGAKDYLFEWLTGVFATDPSTAAGYGNFDLVAGAWDSAVGDAFTAISGSKLPRLPGIAASDIALPVISAAANQLGINSTTRVCLGAADSVLGAIGMGVGHSGDIAYVGGTSSIILGISQDLVFDEQRRFLITPMASPDLWGFEMDLLSTGSAIRWLSEILGLKNSGELIPLAQSADPVSMPTFLPYVAPGEQGALWDSQLAGSLHGLHLGTTRAEIARSLIDGIIVESRRCTSALADHGFAASSLRVSGGSTQSPWFRQLLADACGLEVLAGGGEEPDRSAFGAAIIAAAAIGITVTPVQLQTEAILPVVSEAEFWSAKSQRVDQLRLNP